jgi:hypothetical protein
MGGVWCSTVAQLPVSNVWKASASIMGKSAAATTSPIRALAFDAHAKVVGPSLDGGRGRSGVGQRYWAPSRIPPRHFPIAWP